MTEVELEQIAALSRCRFSPGSTAKAFVRRLAGYAAVTAEEVAEHERVNPQLAEATRKFTSARELSDKERAFLNDLAHQYRGQIGRCMSTTCFACESEKLIGPDEIRVALDAFLEGRDEYADRLPTLRKVALATYNHKNGTKFAHPYEYATRAKPQHRTAATRGDIYCRFCGERLFTGVKQPHKLVAGSIEAQRHLTVCALQILAGMRETAPPGYRTAPMDDWR